MISEQNFKIWQSPVLYFHNNFAQNSSKNRSYNLNFLSHLAVHPKNSIFCSLRSQKIEKSRKKSNFSSTCINMLSLLNFLVFFFFLANCLGQNKNVCQHTKIMDEILKIIDSCKKWDTVALGALGTGTVGVLTSGVCDMVDF